MSVPSTAADDISVAPRAVRTLIVVLLGFLMLPMSMSGAGVAVPRIGAELHTSGPEAQWIVTAYFLTASSLMLVAGSLGDVIGRRRIYRIGAVAYLVGSLAAGLAPSIEVLLAARVVTGFGAAGVMAGGGAIIGATFTGSARTRAFAAMGTIGGLGLALGPSLSGWLIDGLGWRLGFGLFAVPGLVLFMGTWLMGETRAASRPRIDATGAVTFIGGLAALMLAVTQGPARGWAAPEVLGILATALILFAAFIAVERRTANPVLHLSVLSQPRFVGWLLAAATMSFGFGGILAFLPSYLQDPVGLDAGQAGLVMMLPTLPMMVLPLIGSRLINRGVSPRLLITAALVVLSAGNAWLTVLHPTMTILEVAGPLVVTGAGAGLAAGIIDAQAMNEVSAAQVGMAAGMLNTVRGSANALLLALFGSTLVALLASKLGSTDLAGQVATGNLPDLPDAAFLAAQLTSTWRVILTVLASLCFLAAMIASLLLRGASHDDRRQSG
ncbi:MFS transporter [Kribbella kalugense]|uniref:EmrB/QacA subfamily drug resistance transporter n=1 Tax=Kribbella kalugense TaxID=2512221 RepID=A0A4R8A200_9ACTN|nr:MFS transporter [Kribbella kalugense]TDW24236.1 EmrB/QacA subfamily drug resistance transporter [Kribbella kalugense]